MNPDPVAALRRTLLRLASEAGFDRHPVAVPRRRGFYRAGDADRALYLLQQGLVVTSFPALGARRVFADLLVPGQVFGDPCLGSEPRRVETALALRDAVALRIPASALLARLSDPALLATLVNWLADRTLAAQARAIELRRFDTRQRLALQLARLSDDLASHGDGERGIPRLTHQEWADCVGTTRSRVCGFLGHFRDLGMIADRPDGGLMIDAALLREFARTGRCSRAAAAACGPASPANPVDPTL